MCSTNEVREFVNVSSACITVTEVLSNRSLLLEQKNKFILQVPFMEYNPILLYIELERRRYLFSVHTHAFYVELTGRTLGSVRRSFSMPSHLPMAPVSSAADRLSHCPFKCARTYGDTCRNHSVHTCVYLLKRGNKPIFN